MTLKNRLSLIATCRVLASILITVSALTGAANAQNPVPLINQPLVPDAIAPGGAGFTLTVNGTGFASGSVVKWNGTPRATTFVSQSRLTARILSSDIAKQSTAALTVVNPTPGGGTSNVLFFTISVPAPSFSLASSTFTSGSTPFSMITGDFNGDGKLDVAVSNCNSNDISVRLGNGDGTFQNPDAYSVGTCPFGIAVGDFNGDGNLDLAVANWKINTLSVLLGNGDGTFRLAKSYEAGNGARSVVVGDFNGDGKLDLAVANQNCTDGGPPCGQGTVSILLGNGDGSFQAHVDYQSADGPTWITTGDFNGDGKLDLAVSASNGGSETEVSVLLGDGHGVFQQATNYTVGLNPVGVATADFNKDGKLDLAVVNNAGSISILLGKGDGTFQTHVDYTAAAYPVGIAIADFNEDGNLDLAVANAGSNTVSFFMGKGDGTFGSQVQSGTGAQPYGVAVGDFNQDGRLDLAATNSVDGTVSILLQNEMITISPQSLNFGVQVVGTASAAKNVTFTNIGTTTLTISSITVTGTNAAEFSRSHTCGSSLAPHASCTISVTFTPGQVGPQTALIAITDSAPGSPQSVALSGTGVVSGPDANLSRTSLTFGTQLVGTSSSPQSVTLTNYGTAPLMITSIVASGDFSQTDTCDSSVAAGASCTISVTFNPTKIGSRTGTLSITDNAPGSPQTVSLKGTGTVVRLDPSSLSFHCHNQPNTCPPPPQTSTLTNTGSTTLIISSITITGSTTFSQTHTCGSTVAAKGSCTITVTFNSSTRGTFSGAVSVSDNGGGSPQRVVLSATETKRSISTAARTALSTIQTATVPAPTGPSQVGTQLMDMVDSSRDDQFLADGTRRELLVRFWYPASVAQGCVPAEYTAPAVWSYFSQLAKIPLPKVSTNSCMDAPLTEGLHPVVVFTHGYTGTFTDYTFLAEDLASRGYVVASVDHTYEATAVQFPDGRLVKSVLGSHLAESTWRRDEQALSFAVSARLSDLKFMVDELERLNAKAGSPFAGKLDMTRVAVAGHSLGGLTALLSVEQEKRFRAGITIDGDVSDAAVRVTNTPVLILSMGHDRWSDNECRLWSDLRGARLAVNLEGAEHVTPSDAVWLAKDVVNTGTAGPEKTVAAIRDYIAAFLDSNLRDRPMDLLLTGPSSDYPDAQVITQKQLRCGRTDADRPSTVPK
jgi:predicted dienelactone hydrolase